MPVKTVEEATVLFAVHRIVGGIKVQNEFLRRPFERSNELLEKRFVQLPGCVTIRPVLETTQGRGTGQTLIPFHRRLQCYVLT